MEHSDQEAAEGSSWAWVAAAVGAAVGVIVVVSLLRRHNPVRRMDQLLRRCEARIQGLEAYLGDLESSLQASRP